MSFLNIILTPLWLLILDYFLWFYLTKRQFIWFIYILIIIAILFNPFLNKWKINLKWSKSIFIFIWINIINIEIFKYLITYYHSLTWQMLITTVFVVLFWWIMLLKKSKRKWIINKFKEFNFMLKRENIFLWIVSMLWWTLVSTAYMVMPSSLVSILNNSLKLLWSILSWVFVFKEDHYIFKFFLAFLIIIWLIIINLDKIILLL